MAEVSQFEPQPGSRWCNVHTGREATVFQVVPVEVLGGERRVFPADDPDGGNGWSLQEWRRCWAVLEQREGA